MKKWNQFLKENEESVLQEFNKKDETAVMEDEDRFSVSFEIELEAEGVDPSDNWAEMEDDMRRARDEAAVNYFGDAEEYFRETAREHDVPDNLLMEDGQEFFEWYYNYVKPMTLKNLDLIRLAIAHHEQMDKTVELLKEAMDSYFKDPWKLLRVINNISHARNELMDLLGWTDSQLTLPFEKEGGKALHPGYEDIMKDRKILTKIVKYFIGNLEDLQSSDLFPEAKFGRSTIGIDHFFSIYGIGGSQGFLWVENAANATIEGIIGHVPESYGHTTYEDFFDYLDVHAHPETWEQRVLDKYFGYVEASLEEMVEEQVNEFESDPAEYLDNMGYEEFFDEEDFRMRWYDSDRSQGSCSLEDLEYALRDHFPVFMDKYETNLKFEEDGSLTCGIEFSWDNPPYMVGLETAIEYLKDFFDEYDDQSYFSFTHKTGLHTNIGYLGESGVPVENYNLFKGLMFLNHRYATRGVGFPSREFNRWAGDLKEPAIKNIKAFIERMPERSQHDDVLTKESFMKKYLSKNFDELSDILSSRVLDQARQEGSKSIGFNVNYTQSRNYIEFRYPGQEDPTLESMTKALKYYAFVVKASADDNFKKREYLSDLVGFINNLRGEKVSIAKMNFHKVIKPGAILLKNSYRENIYKIFQDAMDQSLVRKEAHKSDAPDDGLGEYFLEREKAQASRDMTVRCLNMLSAGFARSTDGDIGDYQVLSNLQHNYPTIYRGVNSKGKVTLDVIKYDENQSGDFIVERIQTPAKAFQLEIDSHVYSWNIPDQYRVLYEALIKIILNSAGALDMSKRLYTAANEAYHQSIKSAPNDESGAPKNLPLAGKYEFSDGPLETQELSKQARQAREDAEDERILNHLVNDILSGR